MGKNKFNHKVSCGFNIWDKLKLLGILIWIRHYHSNWLLCFRVWWIQNGDCADQYDHAYSKNRNIYKSHGVIHDKFSRFSLLRQGSHKFMLERGSNFYIVGRRTTMDQIVLLSSVYPTLSLLRVKTFSAIPLRDPCALVLTFSFNEWLALLAWGILRRQRK